jgi:hypothetical protein
MNETSKQKKGMHVISLARDIFVSCKHPTLLSPPVQFQYVSSASKIETLRDDINGKI